ncbi:MAG: bifunctional hydroxymethylpyrimidine kinase/phosphomethylpyrimidine kinase [Lactobacillus sp.]|nr:bifunctional hydroxymethylpyrimidine kinase/phosphomethylpyrimidine kinase [Lactobacillus sp.]
METIALTIAGHDSDGSAGMPADLHSFFARGVYGMGLLTAAVAGNSKGIFAQQIMPLDFIKQQFEVLYDDFDIKAVKTGMLANEDVIGVVSAELKKHQQKNIVLDPVIITKHGAELLTESAYAAFLEQLLPLATLITPNYYEQVKLAGQEINTKDDVIEAAHKLQALGAKNVLMKGKHEGDEAEVADYLLLENGESHWFTKPYVKTDRVNGTGDTLSTVITAELAKGTSLVDAVKIGKDFTYKAISNPIIVGSKYGPINHLAAFKEMENK